MNHMDEPKVVTIGKAARHLASTTRVVKGLVKRGELVGVRLPNRVRYSGVTTESLNKLIAKSTVIEEA
jgi:hypothetical protein